MLRSDWNAAKAAVIICDMWDAHHCVTAARRVVEMAPRVNAVVAGLRVEGALVVHAPGGCVAFYSDTPARMRAIQAPQAQAPGPIDWNGWDQDKDAVLWEERPFGSKVATSSAWPGSAQARAARPDYCRMSDS